MSLLTINTHVKYESAIFSGSKVMIGINGFEKCVNWLGFLFMPPVWKVRRRRLVIGSSIRLSIHPFVRNSVPLTNKVQYLKFGSWYSNQTWSISSSWLLTLHFHPMPLGVGWGQRFLPYFDFVAAGGIRVSQTHVLFMLCHNWRYSSLIWKRRSKFKVKITRSQIMTPFKRYCHKECTCEIWKLLLFWFKRDVKGFFCKVGQTSRSRIRKKKMVQC